MNMTSASLAYLFLIIAAVSCIFFFYFKILVMNTSEESKRRDKIIGDMKDPVNWRKRNNTMSYVFLFWTLVSFAVFVYIKYYLGLRLISAIYVIGFLVVMVISLIAFGAARRKTTQ